MRRATRAIRGTSSYSGSVPCCPSAGALRPVAVSWWAVQDALFSMPRTRSPREAPASRLPTLGHCVRPALPLADPVGLGQAPVDAVVILPAASRLWACNPSWHHRHLDCQDHTDGWHQGLQASKKINDRKRHLAVDTFGFLIALAVQLAGVEDYDGTSRGRGAPAARVPGLLSHRRDRQTSSRARVQARPQTLDHRRDLGS